MITIEQAKNWYQNEDPVHGFDHILRVYQMSDRLAREVGADLEIVHAAALLHDAEGSATHGGNEGRRNHHEESALFARQVLEGEGWPDERIQAVLHCIRAHRFRGRSEAPQTLEAKVIFDADKLDVLGAIGAVRTIAFSVVNQLPVYHEPSPRFLESWQEEPGEPHSSYHEFLFKLAKIKDLLYTPLARELAEERHTYLAKFFERLGAELRGEI
jgi:uncharacterized protein